MKDLKTCFPSVRRHAELGGVPEREIKLTASPKMHLCLLHATEFYESPWKQKAKGGKSSEIILYRRRTFSGKLLNVAIWLLNNIIFQVFWRAIHFLLSPPENSILVLFVLLVMLCQHDSLAPNAGLNGFLIEDPALQLKTLSIAT